jgi:dTDP-L-rhamnose 4-epimerase
MRALVTGGAGLIGSHIADLLIRDGWSVRILDNLEPQTHRHGKPAWIPDAAQFINADIRDRDAVAAALRDIDFVFHQAAYGGYMPEIGKFVAVNSFGTAQMLEIIRDEKLPIKKVIVASSQAVYPEGAAKCEEHGTVFPPVRQMDQLRRGDFAVCCPQCRSETTSIPTPEEAPITGEGVYAITKVDQERLVLAWGRQTGIPTVALRYSCTYGPRQSIFNPYTGVIAIFCTRLLSNEAPVLYEDGLQTRDFCFVEDIAAANLLVALDDKLDGQPVNVGSGKATSIRDLAKLVSNALDIHIDPLVPGAFRPGEIRHLISDTTRIRSLGFVPKLGLQEGIERYLSWIRSQANVSDYFSAAETGLRAKGMIQRVSLKNQKLDLNPGQYHLR